MNEASKQAIERRYRIYVLGYSEFGTAMRALECSHEYLSLPKIKGPPPGSRLVSVEHCFSYHAFLLLYWHESFDIVPDGCEIPRANDPCVECTAVRFLKKDLPLTKERIDAKAEAVA